MRHFWRYGYGASSIDTLIRAIGISRHSLYGDFGGKDALFVACLAAYCQAVVTPAFAPVEAPQARLTAIGDYFETQIARAEAIGLPGPGCLMANTLTEIAPHDARIALLVGAHHQRLHDGFERALANEAHARGKPLSSDNAADLARMLVVFATGLWSMSRAVGEGAPLRQAACAQLRLIEERISR